jgi:hypothetical protein
MLIYEKLLKKKLFYGRTTQNYSSEPHKKRVVLQFKKHAIYGIFSSQSLSDCFNECQLIANKKKKGDNFSRHKLLLAAHNTFSRRRIIFFIHYFSKRTTLF